MVVAGPLTVVPADADVSVFPDPIGNRGGGGSIISSPPAPIMAAGDMGDTPLAT